jgi:hypothetical protein
MIHRCDSPLAGKLHRPCSTTVRLGCNFGLLAESDRHPWDREIVVSETIRQSASFIPLERKRYPKPFSLLVKCAKPPDPVIVGMQDLSQGQLNWQVDWLLEKLCLSTDKSEIPEIMKLAWMKACGI